MKIVTVVGARPQFIKAAVISRVLRNKHQEIIVHTGQHYDKNMSDIFFSELEIPKPDYNLGISGMSHGKMTGEMLIKIEEVLLKEEPDMVILYGDTNSTLAGALAAAKLHIPICHIEAGVRLGTLNNPEEVNRILTDHVSEYLMCCTQSAVDFLKNENITENVYIVGDPMYDAFKFYAAKIDETKSDDLIGLDGEHIDIPPNFYYMTCHREENTGTDEPIIEILAAMNSLEYPTIYPVHPRNYNRVKDIKQKFDFSNIILCQPVGYLTSVFLILKSTKIVTDSGGLQREAFFAKKQCVTVFDRVIWPETMVGNWNQLASANGDDIIEKLSVKVIDKEVGEPFGDGNSAKKIVDIITDKNIKRDKED